MAKYKLTFPRIEEDILSKRRTVVHLPCDAEELRHITFRPGDIMSISAEYAGSTVARITFTDVTKCHIQDCVAGDLTLLNLPSDGLDSYRIRWDAANPDAPFEGNPLVWRIVFHYLSDRRSPEAAPATT
jgi:hypothetical protein